MAEQATTSKKEYRKPKIVHTEAIESHAVSCAMADDNSCAAGPIQS